MTLHDAALFYASRSHLSGLAKLNCQRPVDQTEMIDELPEANLAMKGKNREGHPEIAIRQDENDSLPGYIF